MANTILVPDDEALDRDINHGFASKLGSKPIDPKATAPCQEHAPDIGLTA